MVIENNSKQGYRLNPNENGDICAKDDFKHIISLESENKPKTKRLLTWNRIAFVGKLERV